MNKFYILQWSFNEDRMSKLDILPYLRREIADHKPFETYEDFKEFIDLACRYQFWARCEYEFIAHGWPSGKKEEKIDGYSQIENNLDIITKILWEEYKQK